MPSKKSKKIVMKPVSDKTRKIIKKRKQAELLKDLRKISGKKEPKKTDVSRKVTDPKMIIGTPEYVERINNLVNAMKDKEGMRTVSNIQLKEIGINPGKFPVATYLQIADFLRSTAAEKGIPALERGRLGFVGLFEKLKLTTNDIPKEIKIKKLKKDKESRYEVPTEIGAPQGEEYIIGDSPQFDFEIDGSDYKPDGSFKPPETKKKPPKIDQKKLKTKIGSAITRGRTGEHRKILESMGIKVPKNPITLEGVYYTRMFEAKEELKKLAPTNVGTIMQGRNLREVYEQLEALKKLQEEPIQKRKPPEIIREIKPPQIVVNEMQKLIDNSIKKGKTEEHKKMLKTIGTFNLPTDPRKLEELYYSRRTLIINELEELGHPRHSPEIMTKNLKELVNLREEGFKLAKTGPKASSLDKLGKKAQEINWEGGKHWRMEDVLNMPRRVKIGGLVKKSIAEGKTGSHKKILKKMGYKIKNLGTDAQLEGFYYNKRLELVNKLKKGEHKVGTLALQSMDLGQMQKFIDTDGGRKRISTFRSKPLWKILLWPPNWKRANRIKKVK